MADKPSVPAAVFLMGPTAVGKSSIVERLYERLDFELISVDSGQVYRGMDIGTAKPDQNLQQRVPHHLIDIRDITENYSAAQFRNDALNLIKSIQNQGKTPLLAGGTMFYFSVLENGLSKLPQADLSVREEIERIKAKQGLEYLYRWLLEMDPSSAKKIKANDEQRIKRALELYRITGQPPSLLFSASRPQSMQLPYLKIALFRPRAILHSRIKSRFMEMIEQGLVQEAEKLTAGMRKPETLSSMRSVGYRQVIEFLDGKLLHAEMIEKGIAATRQLAKRQLTWLRNQANAVWVNAEAPNAESTLAEYLESRKFLKPV